ncbi:unnamed protein product [Ectocarpus fasciculatus]
MRDPLLRDDSLENGENNEDETPEEVKRPPSKRGIRLVSLDVLRGITIALMIFVDFVGESWAAVDHEAWDGIRLADFVMPSFDFIVGISVVMSQRTAKFGDDRDSKWTRFQAAFIRTVKLFVLGILTQAGTVFPTYDLKHLRIMGILQRVSLCYLTAATTEILIDVDYTTPSSINSNTRTGTVQSELLKSIDLHVRRWKVCLVSVLLISLHTALIYGVKTHDDCERGSTSPRCNSAGWIDSKLLGISHMYFPTNGGAWEDKEVTFQRTEDCSTCYPGRCAPPEDAPEWCGYDSLTGGAPFDPEGLVSSLTAVVASLLGAHCGAVAKHMSRSQPSIEGRAPTLQRYSMLVQWFLMGASWLIIGGLLVLSGNRLNTDLYSVSFLFVSTGTACLGLCLCSAAVDSYSLDSSTSSADSPILLRPFRWLGLNSILIYILSCSGVTESIISVFYWDKADNNIANALYPTGYWWGPQGEESYVPTSTNADSVQSSNLAVIMWCLFGYIPFWMAVAGYLHRIKYYLKV